MASNHLDTAVEALHVKDIAEYRALHRSHAEKVRVPFTPHDVDDVMTAYVGAGTWRIRCTCGDAPSTHPVWRIACCSGCGALYRDIIFPDDIAEIEAVLLKRPNPSQRNWRLPETVEELREQNVAHGDPI